MDLPRNKLLIISVILFSLLLFSNLALAQKVTLQEGLNLGLKNNTEIMKLQKDLARLKRELKKIKAGSDWQIETNLKTQVSNFNNNGISNEEDDNSQKFNMSMSATKNYWSGLTLKPEVYSRHYDSLEREIKDVEFQFDISQDIYPQRPVEAEQSYIKQKLELKQAQVKLEDKKNSKIINWIENYLDLVRLKESYGLVGERYRLAQKELDEILAQKKIGEASELDVLSAKANLKQAQHELKNTRSDYQQAKKSLANELGLSEEQNLVLTDDPDYLIQLQEIVNSFPIEFENKAKLVDLAINNSVELLQNELNKRSSEHELQWNKLEEGPDINLNGSYNSFNEEWRAEVSLSYNIFDSGLQELEVKNLTERIDTFDREYQDLIKGLKLEVDELVNQIEANRTNLEGSQFSLEKSKLDKKIAKKQLQKGLLAQVELQEKKLALREAKINLQAARDKLLISKLKLIEYVDSKDFLGGK